MDGIKFYINDKEYTGRKGQTVLELCRENGIEIPTLCHDDRLKPYSSCFLCVVDIEGWRTLQPACSTKISPDMKIQTDNERVRKSRKAALELLLSNHYADCLGPCKLTCPAGVDVQGYISLIEKGMYSEAVGLIKETNPLPAICGRVCVRPCEVACRRNLIEDAGVGIDYLKRYASDEDLASGNKFMPEKRPPTGKKVCVIGAGPAGLTSAYYLALEGHNVDIIEAMPHGGGMLRYGIPAYRLPNDLLQKEIDSITELGVSIKYNTRFGTDIKYPEIKEKYDAMITSVGCWKGSSMRVENEDSEGVLPGIDFLRPLENPDTRPDFTGKVVATIGGGNTAMDCCRSALRCGAEKSYIIYRRTEAEMPANPIEIHESKLEGVEYMLLTLPKKVNTDENGRLKTLTCIKMKLGEPDDSGRRRPVPIEGTEFDLELDYILSAIGQKTVVDFVDDINSASEGNFELNKWKDIDADPETLQTGVPSIFAAGDAVTGAATLIEGINQGRIAAKSCHQYLMDHNITGEDEQFYSSKDIFADQVKEDYVNEFESRPREEMPVLPKEKRMNFEEVELGYTQDQACNEVNRCLECGCDALYTCDLKKYSTEYGIDQEKFKGSFQKYDVDYSHPFVEIDNNKCILCSRCIRVCSDIVGAGALGLVNRGFDTFVAPALGGSLTDTKCESCGMCIDTCPTGAISENQSFKPGPFETETVDTVCNYCSLGCGITLHHRNGYFVKAEGKKGAGKGNPDGNLCKYGRFGYKYLNDKSRITSPLIKKDGKFEEATFEEAYALIAEKIKSASPEENAFAAGARLTNEELFLVSKLARQGVKTNNLMSFHYHGRECASRYNWFANTPFHEVPQAGTVFFIGSEINKENAVLGFRINSAEKEIKQINIYDTETSAMIHKCEKNIKTGSYTALVKAMNHIIIRDGLVNKMFIDSRTEGFEEYKKAIEAEDLNILLKDAGLDEKTVKDLVTEYDQEQNAVIIFNEKNLSTQAAREIFNLALLTGKLGKTASGVIALKEKNNAQGLFDMGVTCCLEDEVKERITKKWGFDVSACKNDHSNIKNLFVFGEDPVGCGPEKIREHIAAADFRVVSDYFMTETAELADVILPASFPIETGGTFTNTLKWGIGVESGVEPGFRLFREQLCELMGVLGVETSYKTIHDIDAEAYGIFNTGLDAEGATFVFESTQGDSGKAPFEHGCDILVKRADEEFSVLDKK